MGGLNILPFLRVTNYEGSIDDADTICNTYVRRGVHFLKTLWAE